MKRTFQLTIVSAFISALYGCGNSMSNDAISCNSLLTQSIFYSVLLEKNDKTKDLAKKVKGAESIKKVNQLVSLGSNIDANRTLWFRSSKESTDCEAQIFLHNPNSDGENTAYIDFSISGYIPMDDSKSGVLESIHVNWLGAQWFKE